MKTFSQDTTRDQTSQPNSARWRWMAGAMALSAAGTVDASAKTVQIDLTNNGISASDLSPFHLDGDLTGDGINDLSITYQNAFHYLTITTSHGFEVDGFGEAKAVVNHLTFGATFRYHNGSFRVGSAGFQAGTLTDSVHGTLYLEEERHYLLPVSFTDALYNAGKKTNGYLEILLEGTELPEVIFKRLIFDDASTSAPNVGVAPSQLLEVSPPQYPIAVENPDPKLHQATDFDNNGTPDLLLFAPTSGFSRVYYFKNATYVNSAAGPRVPGGSDIVGNFKRAARRAPGYLIYNRATRTLTVWNLKGGTSYTDATTIGETNGSAMVLPAGFEVAAIADMNGDGEPDLILYNATTRRILVRYISSALVYTGGTWLFQGATYAEVPAGWQIGAVADFNGDKKPEIMLFNLTTSETRVWYLTGNKVTSQANGPTISNHWHVAGAADYNGDGKPDLMIFDPVSKETGVWYLNGLTVFSAKYMTNSANVRFVLPSGYNIVAP